MHKLNTRLFVLTGGQLLVRTSMYMALDLVVRAHERSPYLNYMYAKNLPYISTAAVLSVQRLGLITSEY